MTEARLEPHAHGLLPSGAGWYVIDMRAAQWRSNPAFGDWFNFEGDQRFEDFGINVHVLHPGKPACKYHRESVQEGFLVLSGECVAIVEGEERPLRAWQYLHCPAGTDHVLVGAGDGPCVVLMVGARKDGCEIVYPVEPAAARYGASVAQETGDPREAYAGTPPSAEIAAAWPRD
ncbi:MAG: cupin domain-containing protein [Planctomycetes bacterium]|nr:cupin domain-containing protein [Planctomycetota bacterium]